MVVNETITIAIPAHNEEESIQRNLQSILNSKFHGKKIEIVVCLSACNDNTRQRLLEFKKKHPKVDIKIVESRIKGKVRAIKRLDSFIKTKIRVFIDADCGSKSDAIYRIYSKLKNSDENIKIVSGNAVDPRYTNKNKNPKSLIEAFNRAFWQHAPRKIVNGQFFAARKGVVQMIPNNLTVDDIFLSICLWNNFLKDNKAIIIQGSAQTMYEVVRYQKNIQSAKKQIEEYLRPRLENFPERARELYDQFDIKFSDKRRYYPNITYLQLFLIKMLIKIGEVWGLSSKPTWNKTTTSKEIAID